MFNARSLPILFKGLDFSIFITLLVSDKSYTDFLICLKTALLQIYFAHSNAFWKHWSLEQLELSVSQGMNGSVGELLECFIRN